MKLDDIYAKRIYYIDENLSDVYKNFSMRYRL